MEWSTIAQYIKETKYSYKPQIIHIFEVKLNVEQMDLDDKSENRYLLYHGARWIFSPQIFSQG